ncbi:DNA-binding NarL/FixJ family response regulator [Labrys wisconsinensis]|uniref:DNA-binding NarL/FixJ family response regulator n=2 Tax=Labrys wisconsinensis TaxID=425677 RepID=A0ABU0J444_9HYPH|nr:response regulator transcription factor [Labrys wisconsinensis]MDQ0469047.1 DNA-binding NarL/FixJ family response regulator [Labrys wisconsinensis]
MARPIRIMLVDDHAIVLEGYRRLLDKQSDMEVVAEAGDGRTAYQRYKEVQPDVLVLDISMPGRGGIDIIGQIRLWDPQARIVVFTMHQSAVFAVHAFQAGAMGYITKSSKPMLLVRAITEVFAGRRALSPDISQELALSHVGAGASALESLSPREFEVLRLILRAKTCAEIASTLNLSPKTVANYHYLLKQKLGVGSDIELLYLGLREGLVTSPVP